MGQFGEVGNDAEKILAGFLGRETRFSFDVGVESFNVGKELWL